MEKKMKKVSTWAEHEAKLLKEGRITEEGMMIEKMKMDFSVLIYDLRTAKRLTQKQLADKIGVKQQYIAKIEGGEENLSLETIGKLLIALKTGLHVEIQKKQKLTGIFEVVA